VRTSFVSVSSKLMATGDPDKDGWERSDFPILCETCLGDNPYVRMTKQIYEKECKICGRPFTVFRWQAGTKGRYKKTEICQSCAKLRNCCQTCILDLQFGLPLQVRDSVLPKGAMDPIPASEVNRDYFAIEADKKLQQGMLPYDRAVYSPVLQKLARPTPYYERNRAHICSFFVKGNCSRGELCPFRHEMPVEGELAHQNIKDRYYGVNDPVAKKLLNRARDKVMLNAPNDKDIKTLYIGNVDSRITEEDLRDHFYHFGEIRTIRMQIPQRCAFIEFTTREAAEAAANKLHKNLIVKGVFLKVDWARPKDLGTDAAMVATTPTTAPEAPADPLNLIPPPPPGFAPVVYPSMNPTRLGAIPEEAKHKPQEDRSQFPSATPPATTSTVANMPLAPPGYPYPMYTPVPPNAMFRPRQVMVKTQPNPVSTPTPNSESGAQTESKEKCESATTLQTSTEPKKRDSESAESESPPTKKTKNKRHSIAATGDLPEC
jgi:pre-mRNA-splicing factor RBM22/SLT11